MKKHIIILLVIIALNPNGSNAIAQEKIIGNIFGGFVDFDNLTEEQYQQRDDSIKKALYQEPEIVKIERPDTASRGVIKMASTAAFISNSYVPNKHR
jgi:hypothetical protein